MFADQLSQIPWPRISDLSKSVCDLSALGKRSLTIAAVANWFVGFICRFRWPDVDGPLLLFVRRPVAAGQLHQTSHPCIAQHFVGLFVGVRTKQTPLGRAHASRRIKRALRQGPQVICAACRCRFDLKVEWVSQMFLKVFKMDTASFKMDFFTFPVSSQMT